ncbi:MAG TPA: CsbD family protein [Acidobacteriaceae bacterium]|nr:CsbD family protein [Acidobacteriaceae bacterium]
MKTIAWLAAGIGIGLAVYLIANPPELQYATGSDNLEGAARNAQGWGMKQRATGLGRNVAGRVKEGLGNLTGNPDLADEGLGDRIEGNVREGVGKVAQAAGQTLHDLNR